MKEDDAALAVGYSSTDSMDSMARRRPRGDTAAAAAATAKAKTGGGRQHQQRRQRSRRPLLQVNNNNNNSFAFNKLLGESGSTSRLLGSLLLIGIVFCLMDVLYIVRYVHERPVNLPSSSSSSSFSSSFSSSSSGPNAVAAAAAADPMNRKPPPAVVLPTTTTNETKKQIRLPDAALNGEKKKNNNNNAESSVAAIVNDTNNEKSNDERTIQSKHDARAGGEHSGRHHHSNQDANDSKPAAEAETTTTTTSVQSNKDTVTDNINNKNNNNSIRANITASTAGKEPLLQLLHEAGVEIDDEIINKLPTWDQITALYGEEPVVFGLDQCEKFQQLGDPADHFVSVAGTFNTGTNLMSELLIHNCHMPARMKRYGKQNRGVRWQVLWGKHTPVGDEQFRLTHRTYNESELLPENIFPAVTVRDPFKWMRSVCQHVCVCVCVCVCLREKHNV